MEGSFYWEGRGPRQGACGQTEFGLPEGIGGFPFSFFLFSLSNRRREQFCRHGGCGSEPVPVKTGTGEATNAPPARL